LNHVETAGFNEVSYILDAVKTLDPEDQIDFACVMSYALASDEWCQDILDDEGVVSDLDENGLPQQQVDLDTRASATLRDAKLDFRETVDTLVTVAKRLSTGDKESRGVAIKNYYETSNLIVADVLTFGGEYMLFASGVLVDNLLNHDEEVNAVSLGLLTLIGSIAHTCMAITNADVDAADKGETNVD
jgi:hypothetical protein